MASVTDVGIEDEWSSLRENPVFKRMLLPRRLRFLLRSPIPRAAGLTALALFIYEYISNSMLSFWPVVLLAVVFWFLIEAMQRYFCWLDLTMLARTGTLRDYINTGLNRGDVVIGVIYPAVISETLALIGVMGWFLYTAETNSVKVLLAVFIFLNAKRVWESPFLSSPTLSVTCAARIPSPCSSSAWPCGSR